MKMHTTIFNGKPNFILVGLISFLIFTAFTASNAHAAPSDIDFSFGSKIVDGFDIGKAVVQPDGKILIAGGFDLIVSQPQTRMIRLNADGTRDTSFQRINLDARIDDFVLQPDGKVVVAGRFSLSGRSAGQFLLSSVFAANR